MAALRILASLLVGLCAYSFYSRESFSAEMVLGKRVLVTGASTGIGEQIAYQFARMGAHVMVTARREKQLQEVAQKCLDLGAASAEFISSDMGNLTSAQQVVEETSRKLGGLDYLVLNHVGGAGHFGPFQGDVEGLVHTMTVNFFSYVQLTVSALKMLQESGGGLIVVSSLAGRIPAPFSVSYASTKFALEGFYSSLRSEMHLRNIHLDVTVAVLGYIDTDTAVREIGGKVSMTPSPKEDCARHIVQGGVLRQREVIYPYWTLKPMLLLVDSVPGLLEEIASRLIRL